jgi:23S rRNA (cytosine1962-C5)-methyltransferase
LYALREGAELVHSLDSSASALQLTEENVKLNGFDESRHACIQADAVNYIKDLGETYDVIVLDPPAFAKHLSARHKAIQGYKRINEAAIKQIKSGGILFTFSCSQVIDKTQFTGIVLAAAIGAGREVRILHQLHQGPDHPVNIFHPEGEYLKGLVLEVI